MKLLSGILGLVLLLATLWDAFETIILPRRVTRPFRLVRVFFQVTWKLWAGFGKMFRSPKSRDMHLAYYGPLSILMLFATRSEEHTSELQSLRHLVCRLLLEKK